MENDICPVCGNELEPSLAHGIGVGDTGNGIPKFNREERECPKCSSKLVRRVGGQWRLAPE